MIILVNDGLLWLRRTLFIAIAVPFGFSSMAGENRHAYIGGVQPEDDPYVKVAVDVVHPLLVAV